MIAFNIFYVNSKNSIRNQQQNGIFLIYIFQINCDIKFSFGDL